MNTSTPAPTTAPLPQEYSESPAAANSPSARVRSSVPPSAPLTNQPRTLGFPRSNSGNRSGGSSPAASHASPAPGPPTPKRPKGRWFISTVILGVCLTVASAIWNEFFRFKSRGVVSGRVVSLAAPWGGVVQSLQVMNGQNVRQGELIAVLENSELKLRLEKLDDEIRLAQAGLVAGIAEVRAAKRDQDHEALKDFVEYLDILSRLGAEQARLAALETSCTRLQGLLDARAIPESEFDAVRYARDGQLQRVDKLNMAAERLFAGLAALDAESDDASPLTLAKVRLEGLIHEKQRLWEHSRIGEIRAPVAGRVVERNPLTGEFVAAGTIVCQILEAGSTEVVLYVPQARAADYRIGSVKRCTVTSALDCADFEVTRIGQQLVPPPSPLQRYCRSGERMVAVYLSPCSLQTSGLLEATGIWLGAEVLEPRWTWPWHDTTPAPHSYAGLAR